MNYVLFLLEFLKKQGTISLPGFGTFYLHTINAVLDKNGENILPPGTEVAFKADVTGKADDFAEFLAKRKKIPIIDAEIEIIKQINGWNAALHKNQQVPIENLGTLSLEDGKIIFSGNRTENLSPAFYGLEEINIAEIKTSPTKNSNTYQFSKSFFWIIPLLVGVLGLTYVGITQPEMIFGQKSFQNETPKKEVIPVKIDSLKTDSLNTVKLVIDSLKNDSLQKAIVPLKPPAKKWSAKNYSKNKWKKSKKRPNR